MSQPITIILTEKNDLKLAVIDPEDKAWVYKSFGTIGDIGFNAGLDVDMTSQRLKNGNTGFLLVIRNTTPAVRIAVHGNLYARDSNWAPLGKVIRDDDSVTIVDGIIQ